MPSCLLLAAAKIHRSHERDGIERKIAEVPSHCRKHRGNSLTAKARPKKHGLRRGARVAASRMRSRRVQPGDVKRNCSQRSREHHQSSNRIQKRDHLRGSCEPQGRGRAQPIHRTHSVPHLRPPRRRAVPQTEPRSDPESMPLHPVSQKRDGIDRTRVDAPHRRRRQKVMPAKAVMRFCCPPPAGRVFGGSQGSEIHESLCSPPKLGLEREPRAE